MGDRIFGILIIAVALIFIISATQIPLGFVPEPVGPRLFPYIVSGVMILCGLTVVLRPDKNPTWPNWGVFSKLLLAVVVLAIYAYLLRPLGFIVPTAIASAVISYQIQARFSFAILTGIVLSIGLFFIFKYALGLGLFAFPRILF